MLSVTEIKNLRGGVHQQLRLVWTPSNGGYPHECVLNLWVGGCCGFNVLSLMSSLWDLDDTEFDKFIQELSRVFKQRDYGTLFDKLSLHPPYSVNQVFFLYGDTSDQRDTYKHLIARGKEVHRYRSGSEPYHDTVMISIDL